MIHHHPADHHLLALASGHMDSGRGFVVSAHVETCRVCQRRLQEFLEVGGEVFQASEPVNLSPDAFTQTLRRIEANGPAGENTTITATPTSVAFPRECVRLLPSRLLQGCTGQPWRWIGPGMRYSAIEVPHAAQSNVFLLKIAPGRTMPRHSHGGCEFTQILSGSFHDGRARFDAGDFDETDPYVTHQPVVTDDGECICLAYLDAPLRFESWVARAAARWTGFQD